MTKHRPLRRSEVPAYLLDKYGFTRTAGTLAKLAVVGGGPPFRKVGARTVIYEIDGVDAWAESIMSKPIGSTSELTES